MSPITIKYASDFHVPPIIKCVKLQRRHVVSRKPPRKNLVQVFPGRSKWSRLKILERGLNVLASSKETEATQSYLLPTNDLCTCVGHKAKYKNF